MNDSGQFSDFAGEMTINQWKTLYCSLGHQPHEEMKVCITESRIV